MQIEYLVDFLFSKGRLPQSMLLEGKKNWGSFEVALNIAGKLLNENVLDNRFHPDLIILESDKNIKIDEIKSVKEFCYLTPHKSDNKVVIIDDAEKMTIEASNALLKMLEEPLNKRYFIIITSNRNKLLSTIVSRCIIFRLKPDKSYNEVDNPELENFFRQIENSKLSYFDIVDFFNKILRENFETFENFIKVVISINNKIMEENYIKEKFRTNIIKTVMSFDNLLKLNINSKHLISIFALYLKEKKFNQGALDFE